MNHKIVMKKFQEGQWNNIYPETLASNVYDKNGKEIENRLEELEIKNDTDINKLKPISRSFIYVEDFQKLPSDLSDTERVQRAITSAGDNSVVLFAPIVYQFDKAVKIDGINLTLAGNNATIKTGVGINAFESFSETRIIKRNVSLTKLIIKDFQIRGINKTGIGIALTGVARGSQIKNCRFENLHSGVFLTGCWSMSIDNCYFSESKNGLTLGLQNYGGHNGSFAVNALQINGCSFTSIRDDNGTGQAIYSVSAVNGITINGFTCELNDSGFIFLQGKAIYIKNGYFEDIYPTEPAPQQHGIQLGDKLKGLIVDNWSIMENHFNRATVMFEGAINGIFDRNQISGTINRMLRTVDNSNVKGNTFVGQNFDFLMSSPENWDKSANRYVSSKSTNQEIPLTLINGWNHHEQNVRGVLSVTQTTEGRVHIDGSITGGTIGISTPVAVIPEPMRPNHLHMFMCSDVAGNPIGISVSKEGNIVIRTETTQAIDIHLSYKNGLH